MLYLEKKINKSFKQNTLDCFYKQLKVIKRYEYMILPIAILNNDLKMINIIREKYEWLDFERTLAEYNRFFKDIGLK